MQTTRILTVAMAHDGKPALANASVYLDGFGHTVIGWMWLRHAVIAVIAVAQATSFALRKV